MGTRLIQLLIRVSTSERGMCWENSSKDWSTRKRKKKTECFAKFIKRIRRGLKKVQLQFIVCVSDLSTINRSYCRAWAQPSQRFFLWYPWLIWPRWVCAADWGWSPFHPLEFWTGCLFRLKVEEEQSIVTFLVLPSFRPTFAMFLSLKANLIL